MKLVEPSTLQILNIMVRDENMEKINSFPFTSKTKSTLKEKKSIPLYAEDLHFLITRAGWLITHLIFMSILHLNFQNLTNILF